MVKYFLLLCILIVATSYRLPNNIKIVNSITHLSVKTDESLSYHDEMLELELKAIEKQKQLQQKVRKGSVPDFAIEGDSTIETPSQQALLMLHFAMVSINVGLGLNHFTNIGVYEIFSISGTILLSIILGDFATGIFHWSVDNYGSIKTPVVGTVCAAFQGHHDTPWTITFRSFANNVFKICYNSIPALGLLLISNPAPHLQIFFALFMNWWVMSQEFHKYSHMRELPPSVKLLQDSGLILSKKQHGLHHTPPFKSHYCIVNGMCNKVLDDSNFFRKLERLVYKMTGNKPNTWRDDPSLQYLGL